MQSVSSSLFPELLQQEEAEAEGASRQSRTPSAGGRGLGTRSSSKTSTYPFFDAATTLRTSSPPPSPSSLRLSSASPNSLRHKTARRRRATAPGPLSADARSDVVPGAGATSSQSSITGTIRSQLLEKQTEFHAGPVCPPSSSGGCLVRQYKDNQLASAAAHLQSLLASNPVLPAPEVLPTVINSLIPHSSSSSKKSSRNSPPDPETPISTKSASSRASSFAYGLVRRGKDRRLFSRSTKPLQHRGHQPAAGSKAAAALSAGLPSQAATVTEVQADIQPSTTADDFPLKASSLSQSNLKLPASRVKQPAKATFRYPTPHERLKSRPTLISNQRNSSTVRLKPSLNRTSTGPISERRPDIRSAASSKSEPIVPQSSDVNGVRPLARTTTAKPSQAEQNISSAEQQPTVTRKSQRWRTSLSLPYPRLRLTPHDVTPPEREPSSKSAFNSHHGDRYFYTFPPEVMYTPEGETTSAKANNKARSLTTARTEQSRSSTSMSNVTPRTAPREADDASPIQRKRKSLFDIFLQKDTSRNRTPSRCSPSSIGKASNNLAPTPEITVSSPEGGVKPRVSFDVPETVPIPSYFAVNWGRRREDTATSTSPSLSLPPVTPRSSQEPSRGGGRPRAGRRSSSDRLSPFSTPRLRDQQRLKHRPTLPSFEDLSDFAERRQTLPLSTGLIDEDTQTSELRAGSNSEHHTHNVSHRQLQKNKFRKLMTDVVAMTRNIAVRHPQNHDTLSEHTTWTRTEDLDEVARNVGISRSSSFLHRRFNNAASLPATFLRRIRKRASQSKSGPKKSRQSSDHSHEHITADQVPNLPISLTSQVSTASSFEITPADLIVTEFSQTSFVQRYHDSRNAEQQHARRLVEEAIKLHMRPTDAEETATEEHHEMDDLILGYENDVPDHLPSSPLCPLHLKHPSGGKGICPLHGFRLRGRTKASRRSVGATGGQADADALPPLILRESPPSAAALAHVSLPTAAAPHSAAIAPTTIASTSPSLPTTKYRHHLKIVYDSRFGDDGVAVELDAEDVIMALIMLPV